MDTINPTSPSFLYRKMHDLANKLCSIQGATLLMQDQLKLKPDNSLQEYCTVINQEIDSCSDLIGEISRGAYTGNQDSNMIQTR